MAKEVQKSTSSKYLYLIIVDLLKQGLMPAVICSRLNIKKQKLQYYLSSLKRHKIIKKVGYGTWEILKDFNGELPKEVQKHLKDDRAQISDKEFFVIRELTGTSTDLIRKNEKSEPGLRNIDDAELTENQYFLLSALSLQYRSGDTGRFDELFPDFLANALFTFKIASREIMSKNPVDMFQNPVFGYNVTKDLGMLILNNPKLIIPNKTIAFEIEDAPAAMSGQVKLKLIGTEVKMY